MSKGAEVDSSMSERPQHQRPRRLADWLNPTGRRRVHSLIPPSVLITRRRLRESGMRENRTYRLSGGRRPAPAGRASSDPTPRKPGNAGRGKGPQVEAMAKGSRLAGVANGLVPRRRGGMPDVITCTSEGDDPSGRGRQGVNRPDDAPAGPAHGCELGATTRETHALAVAGNPCASRMIPLESPVPAIGTPGSESGRRKRAYGLRTAARPRKRRTSHRALPVTRLPRLYYKVVNFIGVTVCNSIPRETHRGPARVRPSVPWSP